MSQNFDLLLQSPYDFFQRNQHLQARQLSRVSLPLAALPVESCASLPREVTQKVIEGFYPGISTAEVDTLAAETRALPKQERVGASLIKEKFHSFLRIF